MSFGIGGGGVAVLVERGCSWANELACASSDSLKDQVTVERMYLLHS